MKLNARELRELEERQVSGELKQIKRHPIYLILENIYDTYNIGGLFRLADAILAQKIYLCGQTEIPPNPKIKKASIGTYKVVPWKYKKSVKEAIEELKDVTCNMKHVTQETEMSNRQDEKMLHVTSYKLHVVAIEQSAKSIPYTQADYSLPLVLIVGNETYGILPETLNLVDQIVEIPMWGINKSLNVIVSAAIVSYWIMGK